MAKVTMLKYAIATPVNKLFSDTTYTFVLQCPINGMKTTLNNTILL
jgi:hypothetical protein